MLSRLLTGVAKSVVFAAALRTPDTKVRSPSYYLTAWLLLLNYGGPLSGPGLLAGPISGFKRAKRGTLRLVHRILLGTA